MNCPHWSAFGKGGNCGLGLYGGKPSLGVCQKCITAGENNQEYTDKQKVLWEKAWPSGAKKISGCCDRADQA